MTSQPLGYFIVGINLPFIILALQKLGRRFVIATFYSIWIFALGVTYFGKMFHGHCIIENLELFLVAVFGGLILGGGVGLIIRNGASVDEHYYFADRKCYFFCGIYSQNFCTVNRCTISYD